jgi:hypothetical protein
MPADDNDGSSLKVANILRTTDYGGGVPITEESLPFADWSKHDLKKLHFYNLKDDPLEQKNVALDNRELVEEMTERLRGVVRHDADHQLSVQKQFVTMMAQFIKASIGILLAFGMAVLLALRALFSRGRTQISPLLDKTKQQ